MFVFMYEMYVCCGVGVVSCQYPIDPSLYKIVLVDELMFVVQSDGW